MPTVVFPNVALAGVWGSGPSDVFVTGTGYPPTDAVRHYDGHAWSTISSLDFGFRAVHGTGPKDVFVVGFQHIARYDGTAWTPMAPGSQIHTLMDVWVHPDVAIAVAATGQVLRLTR